MGARLRLAGAWVTRPLRLECDLLCLRLSARAAIAMAEITAPSERTNRFEDTIDLERLCIPLDRCVTVVPGPVDPAALSVLEQHTYDQAPVYDPSSRRYWGLVETCYLRSLFESGQPLQQDDPVLQDEGHKFHIGPFVTIFSLLQKMASRRAIIVFRDSDATEYGHVEFIWGLITISDLNRHGVRSGIYRLLADVESGLARCLELEHQDPWKWLRHLDEEYQARVLGYWELSKKQGVDVGPIAALTLSQFIQIICRDDKGATRLGYPSRTQFKRVASGLPSLRNRVMHPVRPLVHSIEDVERVRASVFNLEVLRERVEKLIRSNAE